jgi:hypothetical protein
MAAAVTSIQGGNHHLIRPVLPSSPSDANTVFWTTNVPMLRSIVLCCPIRNLMICTENPHASG